VYIVSVYIVTSPTEVILGFPRISNEICVFWDLTQPTLLIPYRPSGVTYRSYLLRSKNL